MKRTITVIIISLFFSNLKSQEITNINPNSSNQSESIDLTVTGMDTHFSQATSTLWFSQGSSTTVYPSFNVQNNNSIDVNVNFSIYDPTGLYNVNVYNSIDGTVTLENGFTVYAFDHPELISISPESANIGDFIELTITGKNTNFNQATNTIYFAQGSSTVIYPETTEIVSDTEIHVDFDFDADYNTGSYSVNIYNTIDGNLYIEDGFTLDYKSFISKFNTDKIIVFPNPSNGNFRIDNIPEVNCTISIISIEGRILKSYTNESDTFIDISVSGLNGYYLVRISNGSFQSTRKILIH